MSHLLEQLEGRERRAECLRNDKAMREPVCAGLATDHIPGELSSIWCWRCGEGTVAGLCREKRAAFFAECEADARDVMRNRSEK
jgi:hypothetical protein